MLGERHIHVLSTRRTNGGVTDMYISLIAEILLSFNVHSTTRLPVGNITVNH